jgi:hypothetical protein
MSSLSRKLDRRQNRAQKAAGMVHYQIADIAKGCAAEQWEALSKQNAFHRAWPKVEPFVANHWKDYIHVARQILTGMLGDPKRSEEEKRLIYDALLLDGAVNPKAMAEPAKPVVTFNLKG